MSVLETCDHNQIKIKIPKPCQEPPASSKAPNEDSKDMDILCNFNIKLESQHLDHGCNKDQWPYPNQGQDAKPHPEPPATSKAPNHDLKDIDILCTFKIWIEGQNLDHECSKTSNHIHIKIKFLNHSQEPPASSKAQNKDLTDLYVLYTFKIKRESQFGTWVYQRPVTISKTRSRCKSQ